MERDDDWLLLKRYYDGQSTAEERARIPAHLTTAAARQKFMALLAGIDRDLHAPEFDDSKSAYADFARRRLASEPKPVVSTGEKISQMASRQFGLKTQALPGGVQQRGFSWPTLRVGIASALLLGVVVFGTWFVRSNRTHPLGGNRVYQTASGQRSTVRFADGSTMMLGPSTTVAVTTRGFDITGEVYFTVAPHAIRPFVVRTTNALVQVLGTRFSVRHYPNEVRSRVVVEEGRVALEAVRSQPTAHARAVLSSRMLALVTDSGVTVTSGIMTREYTSWTQGILVFNRTPLRDVVVELGHAYGANIRIADSALASRTVIAEVEVSQKPLTQILDAISFILDAHYVRSGSSFVLTQGGGESYVPSGQMPRSRFPQPERQYGR